MLALLVNLAFEAFRSNFVRIGIRHFDQNFCPARHGEPQKLGLCIDTVSCRTGPVGYQTRPVLTII